MERWSQRSTHRHASRRSVIRTCATAMLRVVAELTLLVVPIGQFGVRHGDQRMQPNCKLDRLFLPSTGSS